MSNKKCGILNVSPRRRPGDPFVQLDNFGGEKNPGFGLGLAITKKIIEQHHWDIHINDAELGGAKIIITCHCGPSIL